MEVRELLNEFGYHPEETPVIIGSALCALEVMHQIRGFVKIHRRLYVHFSMQAKFGGLLPEGGRQLTFRDASICKLG